MTKISVIIPVHNAACTVERAIESVISQSYTDWELLICNDASTDNSLEVIHRFNSDKITVLNNRESIGAGLTRQRLLDIASGDYICFLDADDWYEPDFFERMLGYTQYADIVKCKFRHYNASCGEIENTNQYDRMLLDLQGDCLLQDIYDKYNYGRLVLWNGMYKKSLFDGIKFDNIKACEDYICVGQLYNKSDVIIADYYGYNYRCSDNSTFSSVSEYSEFYFNYASYKLGLMSDNDMLQYLLDFDNIYNSVKDDKIFDITDTLLQHIYDKLDNE